MESDGIRSYGLGKFASILDSYVWEVSMDGADEEVGDVDSGGWYGLMRDGASIVNSIVSNGETLTTAEDALLAGSIAVILSEDSQGFVSVDYFDTAEELDAAWEGIVADSENPDDGYGNNGN